MPLFSRDSMKISLDPTCCRSNFLLFGCRQGQLWCYICNWYCEDKFCKLGGL